MFLLWPAFIFCWALAGMIFAFVGLGDVGKLDTPGLNCNIDYSVVTYTAAPTATQATYSGEDLIKFCENLSTEVDKKDEENSDVKFVINKD